MPYCNFDDAHSFWSIFNESKQQDEDMNVGEFVFEKLLTVGELFEGDEEEEEDMPKQHPAIPFQLQPIQPGSLYCSKAVFFEEVKKAIPEKPVCRFIETKFSSDFHTSVFHPPSLIS